MRKFTEKLMTSIRPNGKLIAFSLVVMLFTVFTANAALHTVYVGGDGPSPALNVGNFFSPANITIFQGDEIEFILVDGFHNAESTTGPTVWTTGAPQLFAGTDIVLATLTFNTVGFYDYQDAIFQAAMTGTIDVLPVGAGSCLPGETELRIEIDGASSLFPEEMHWNLLDPAGAIVAETFCSDYAGGVVSDDTVCIVDGVDYTFQAFDDEGK